MLKRFGLRAQAFKYSVDVF